MPLRALATPLALCAAALAWGPAAAVPLTPAEVADLAPVAEVVLKPGFPTAMKRAGSKLIPGSTAWNAALRGSAEALLAARPASCQAATWLVGGCGRHIFEVPSRSMLPTIADGDYVVAAAPTPDAPVRRGDVLAYRVPGRGSEEHMHRVIGLPGDRVGVAGGVVELNGARLGLEATGSADLLEGGVLLAAYRETLPSGRSYRVFWPIGSLKGVHGADAATVVVPPGHYFVMGDDRASSLDSRPPDGVGMSSAEAIVGVARSVIISRDSARVGAPL